MLPDDDTLPFDELDPCCQKEILHKRREKEVKSKLRSVDRSNSRWDAAHNVFTKVNFGWKCICCENSKDYEALFRFKASLKDSKAPEDDAEDNNDKNSITSNNSNDSDDDLLDDFDIPMTENELARIQRLEKRILDEELGKQYGLCKHSEDSPVHMQEYIDFSTHIPLVLHIYQSDSLQSAKIDYILETKLCRSYLGTRFRRISASVVRLAGSSSSSHPWITDALVEQRDSLLCFQSQKLINCFETFEEWGEHLDDIEKNMLRHLNNAHVLREDLPSSEVLLMFSGNSKTKVGEDNVEEEEGYCDDPDCVKKYPHEHVGKGSKVASFAKVNQQGAEALAQNTFLRL